MRVRTLVFGALFKQGPYYWAARNFCCAATRAA